jgi:hypothetical protein
MISNQGSGSLKIQAGKTYDLVGTLAQPRYREPGSSRLFGVNFGNKSIEEISTADGRVLRTIPLPEYPSGTQDGLAFDGEYIYYGNGATKRIHKIDEHSGITVSSFTPVGINYLDGLGFNGEHLLVQDHLSRVIILVDPSTGSTVRSVPIVSWINYTGGLSWGGSRGSIFTANQGYLYELSTSGTVLKSQSNVGGVMGLAYSNTADVLFMAAGTDGSIQVVDPNTLVRKSTLRSGTYSALAADESPFRWIQLQEMSYSVPGGMQLELPLTFDAASLPAGTYAGSLIIASNDPVLPYVEVPLKIRVTSASDIVLKPDSINFESQYVNQSTERSVSVANKGQSELVVSGIRTTDSRFAAAVSSLRLGPGKQENILITLRSATTGPLTALMELTTNDPDEPLVAVELHAVIEALPEVHFSPDSVGIILGTGESASLQADMINSGPGDFGWKATIRGAPSGVQPQSLGLVPEQRALDGFVDLAQSPLPVHSLCADPTTGFVYGRAISSLYRYQPELNKWFMVGSFPGTDIGTVQPVYLGGKIYFPGETLHVYAIETNTWTTVDFPSDYENIVPGRHAATDGRFVYLLRNQGPSAQTMLFRLDPATRAWTSFLGPRLIGIGGFVHHNGVLYCTGGDAITGSGRAATVKFYIDEGVFGEAEECPGLPRTGGVVLPMQRKMVVLGGTNFFTYDMTYDTWTVLANPRGQVYSGLAYVGTAGFSGIYFMNEIGTFTKWETASAQHWLTISPTHGILGGNSSSPVTIGVHAQGLDAGTYQGNIDLGGERLPFLTGMKVTLRVEGAPDIWVSESDLDLGTPYVGFMSFRRISIKNVGTAPLTISAVQSSNPEFSLSFNALRLRTGETHHAFVRINPTIPGNQSTLLTLLSDDPDEPEVTISARANSLMPPVIHTDIDSIGVSLRTGGVAEVLLEVSNQGGSHLLANVNSRDKRFVDATGFYKHDVYGRFWYDSIAPGSSRLLPVKFNPVGLPSGTYETEIEISHVTATKLVKAVVVVESAPTIWLSKPSVDFGRVYVGEQVGQPLVIRNTGVEPLVISSVSAPSGKFELVRFYPVTVEPGGVNDGVIYFRCQNTGAVNDTLVFETNDPNRPVVRVPLSALGAHRPLAVYNASPIVVEVSKDDPIATRTFLIENKGGTEFTYWISHSIADRPSSSSAGMATPVGQAGGDWVPHARSPQGLDALAADESHTKLFGYDSDQAQLYQYDIETNNWAMISDNGVYTTNPVGLVILKRRAYLLFGETRSTLSIFSLDNNPGDTWVPSRVSLSGSVTAATSDGNHIYIAGKGYFGRYDPDTDTWEELSPPTIALSGRGGVSYRNGMIYAHEGGIGRGFARYSIALNSWEVLPALPDVSQSASAIDPDGGRYYALGPKGTYLIYEYDIATSSWASYSNPFFPFQDGALAFSRHASYPGLFAAGGGDGLDFARRIKTKTLPWLRITPLSGTLTPGNQTGIGLNFSATGLAIGDYQGDLYFSTPDTSGSVLLTMRVLNTGPQLEMSSSIFSLTTPHHAQPQRTLTMRNKGPGELVWQFASKPSWLSVSKMNGSLPTSKTDSMRLVFDPKGLPADQAFMDTLVMVSNDSFLPVFNLVVIFTVLPNQAPIIASAVPDAEIKPGQKLEISLTNRFYDPESDPFTLAFTISDTTLVRGSRVDSKLVLEGKAGGTATVAIIATDSLLDSSILQFNVTVVPPLPPPVVGLEPEASLHVTTTPMPFDRHLRIEWGSATGTTMELAIFDLNGRVVLKKDYLPQEGVVGLDLDTRSWAPGLYFYRIVEKGRTVFTGRLVRR